MEEAETKEQAFYSVRLRGLLNLLPVKGIVCTKDVLLQTTWWLECHLDRVLQDRHWESLGGHGRHPESKVSMAAIVQVFDNVLELGHERGGQMAVHE